MPPVDAPVCLITGSGRGLGAAMARHLASQGWRVAIHYRNSKKEALALAARLPDSAAFQGDLSREDEAQKVVEGVLRHFGSLKALINNAGAFTGKKLDELSERDWHTGLQSTLHTAFFTSRAALPALRASGQGRIVNIGDSLAAHAGFTEPAFSYYLGKTGVWMLTQTLAVLEAPQGVTVNCLSPGMLETSLGRRPVAHMPSGRFGSHQDILGALDYLLSPAAGYVTGTHLSVSGGWNIAPWFKSVHAPASSSTKAPLPAKDERLS